MLGVAVTICSLRDTQAAVKRHFVREQAKSLLLRGQKSLEVTPERQPISN